MSRTARVEAQVNLDKMPRHRESLTPVSCHPKASFFVTVFSYTHVILRQAFL